MIDLTSGLDRSLFYMYQFIMVDPVRYLVKKKFSCYITKSKIKKFANFEIIIS